MRSCKKCLYKENHPFGLEFDDKGICYGCIIHEEKERSSKYFLISVVNLQICGIYNDLHKPLKIIYFHLFLTK